MNKRHAIVSMAILMMVHYTHAVNLRTTSLALESEHVQKADQNAVMTQESEDHQTTDDDGNQSALQALLSEDPAGLCSVKELLAMSVNAVLVDNNTQDAVRLGSQVQMECQPGTIPASRAGFTSTCQSSEGDANAQWSSFLRCGQACKNSDLVSDSGSPVTKLGTTEPNGIMKVKCSSWSQDTEVTCAIDGSWSNTEPCKLCDTTELTTLASRPVLSVAGLVAPWSRVQLSCPDGQFAFPAARAAATCEPGGTWRVPPFQCQSQGCTTDDFMPGEVDSSAQGSLAVGSTVFIQRLVKDEDAWAMVNLVSTCTSNGSWSTLEPTSQAALAHESP